MAAYVGNLELRVCIVSGVMRVGNPLNSEYHLQERMDANHLKYDFTIAQVAYVRCGKPARLQFDFAWVIRGMGRDNVYWVSPARVYPVFFLGGPVRDCLAEV